MPGLLKDPREKFLSPKRPPSPSSPPGLSPPDNDAQKEERVKRLRTFVPPGALSVASYLAMRAAAHTEHQAATEQLHDLVKSTVSPTFSPTWNSPTAPSPTPPSEPEPKALSDDAFDEDIEIKAKKAAIKRSKKRRFRTLLQRYGLVVVGLSFLLLSHLAVATPMPKHPSVSKTNRGKSVAVENLPSNVGNILFDAKFKELGTIIFTDTYSYIHVFVDSTPITRQLANLRSKWSAIAKLTSNDLLKEKRTYTNETVYRVQDLEDDFLHLMNILAQEDSAFQKLIHFDLQNAGNRAKRFIGALFFAGAAALSALVVSSGLGISSSTQLSKLNAQVEKQEETNEYLVASINLTNELLREQDEQFIEKFNELKSILEQEIATRNLESLIKDLQIKMSNLRHQQIEFQEAILDLLQGKLSPRLIPLDLLHQAFEDIASKAEVLGLNHRLLPTALDGFLASSLSVVRNSTGFSVFLPYPLTPIGLPKMHLYKPERDSLSLIGQDVHYNLHLGDNLIAVADHGLLHRPVSKAELATCQKYSDTYFCSGTTFQSKKFPKSCIGAVYYTDLNATTDYCDITVSAVKGFYSRFRFNNSDVLIPHSPLESRGHFLCPSNEELTRDFSIIDGVPIIIPKGCYFEDGREVFFPTSNLSSATSYDVPLGWEEHDFLTTTVDFSGSTDALARLREMEDLGLLPQASLNQLKKPPVAAQASSGFGMAFIALIVAILGLIWFFWRRSSAKCRNKRRRRKRSRRDSSSSPSPPLDARRALSYTEEDSSDERLRPTHRRQQSSTFSHPSSVPASDHLLLQPDVNTKTLARRSVTFHDYAAIRQPHQAAPLQAPPQQEFDASYGFETAAQRVPYPDLPANQLPQPRTPRQQRAQQPLQQQQPSTLQQQAPPPQQMPPPTTQVAPEVPIPPPPPPTRLQ